MTDDELQNLVDETLYLVEVGSGSPVADESELAHLLDRLALALRHGVDPGEADPRPEVPARDVEVLRKVTASRFPTFGAYNRASTLLGPASAATLETGHGADDVATIADHLHVVAWLWRNHGRDTAVGYLYSSHRSVWGAVLRRLQGYLHARECSRSEPE